MDIFQDLSILMLLGLFLLGVGTFTLSTISGGGGAMMQIPILNFLIGTTKTAPVINLGAFISRPARIALFWKYINWKVFWYYVPSAMIGAWLASWWFSEVKIYWIQIVVGLFLISTFFQYRFGKKKQSFPVRMWYFIPLGFIISIVGTFTGGMGPILNPFLLNVGIEKEELVGTKAAQSFFLGISQISGYTFFGLLSAELWVYGIALGLGASLGNYFGKLILRNMSKLSFRRWVIAVMVISGIVLIIRSLPDVL